MNELFWSILIGLLVTLGIAHIIENYDRIKEFLDNIKNNLKQ